MNIFRNHNLIPCVLLCWAVLSSFSLSDLTCELDEEPLGVESSSPRFSWKLFSEERNLFQSAYAVEVSDDLSKIGEANMWNSGKVKSSQSILVAYSGKKLEPMRTYWWRARAWDRNGKASEWSEPRSFKMGVLSESDWQDARWIALQADDKTNYVVPGIHGIDGVKKIFGNRRLGDYKLPQFRKTFQLDRSLKRATAYVCGLGQFDFFINGEKVGDHFLDPGWTRYDRQALYVPFDVTDYLQKGTNVLGVMLGNGFFNIPSDRYLKLLTSFGAPKLKMLLFLEYSDGTSSFVVTDGSWKAAESPVTFSSIYGGEDYDATKELPGWKGADYDDSGWSPALVSDFSTVLTSQKEDPLKINAELQPVRIFRNAKGLVYDFGQNCSGIVSLKVKSSSPETIVMRPAELLNPDSTVNQSATGQPFCFQYKTRGSGLESWHPQFTYYGFRYVQVEGGEIVSLSLLHTCSSAPEAGSFRCSKPMFNSICNLIDWAMRSNMASVLTDCPHREKLGWLEQSHLMQHSLMYRYDLPRLYKKIENDITAAQREDGCIPTIAPEYVRFVSGFEDTPEWGSAYILDAWYSYRFYGDKSSLQSNYPSMKRYVSYLSSKAQDNIVAYGLGDWLDLSPDYDESHQLTSLGITATSIYYYDVTLMRQIALLLGETADANMYSELASKIKQSFNRRFFDPTTRKMDRNSQTDNAMPLYVGLVEDEYVQDVAENLVKDIQARGNALTAGEVGYRFVLQTLQQLGRSDVIFDMNSRYDVPGYGWQLAHGATALTESWQAYSSLSNNHFAFGHLMEWFFSGLGGIRQSDESVAFHDIVIDPQVAGDVTSAETSYESPYGTIACSWRLSGNSYFLDVTIPANTKAGIVLPTDDVSEVTDCGSPVSRMKEMKVDEYEGSKLLLTTGSGTYHFEVRHGKH